MDRRRFDHNRNVIGVNEKFVPEPMSVCCEDVGDPRMPKTGMSTTVGRRRGLPAAIMALLTGTWLVAVFAAAVNDVSAAFTTAPTTMEPEFVKEIGNITAPAGRSIKLACTVKDLGTYKVAWMLFDQSAILTVQSHVITRNPRISVSHDKHTTWYLHINDVQEEDKGRYMCQINTATAKTQYGYLHVVDSGSQIGIEDSSEPKKVKSVPPNIDDSLSSSDVIVRENANVTLICKASGSPPPSIRWKRDDNNKISINRTYSVSEWVGSTLEMTKISRLDMGNYLCIASNGVPPSVSKQIKVSVDFPPMLWIPHQLVGVPLGYTITLECHTEAHPTSLNYWTKDDGVMIHQSDQYRVMSTPEKPSYKTNMTLTIVNVQQADYGMYKCVAKNPRGETEGTIRLYKSEPASTSPRPVTTELPDDKEWETSSEMNNSVYESPSSLTNNGKKKGTKGNNSNLNEIGKSEQKASEQDKKRSRDWSNNTPAVQTTATTTLVVLLSLPVIYACWILR